MESQSLHLVRGGDAAELLVFGVRVRILADGASTGGVQSVARLECDPGQGAPPHRHEQAESFFVLEGTPELFVGGEWRSLAPGDFARVAPGEVHAFRTAGAQPATLLNFATPSGHEHFFREADALFRSGRFSPETAAAVCAANGITLVME